MCLTPGLLAALVTQVAAFCTPNCLLYPITSGATQSQTVLRPPQLFWGALTQRDVSRRQCVGTHGCQMVDVSAVKKVAIVGAGTGGLALANALIKLPTGVQEVTVFEKYNEIRPGIGGGIQINGGAVVLARLGLGDQIKASGIQTQRILTRAVGGRVLLDLDVVGAIRGDAQKAKELVHEGTPMSFTIMRDRLQQILSENLPAGTLRLGKDVTAVEEHGEGARLSFADGSPSQDFDLVVGADGVKSKVKAFVSGGGKEGGADDAPLDSGIRIQFGVAPAGQRPAGAEAEMHQWFGGDTYCLTASYGGMEGKRFEMMAVVYGDAGSGSKPENADWDPTNVRGACLKRLQERGFPGEVLGVADACERWFDLGVFYRWPFQPWQSSGAGRVVLMGDAAHAMPPMLGQGANQAIQDAYCLADRIVRVNQGGFPGGLAAALRDYTGVRQPVVAQLLAKSFILGKIETASGPLGEAFRDNFFATMATIGVAKQVWLDGAMPKV